jgi:ferrous iron transport protein A
MTTLNELNVNDSAKIIKFKPNNSAYRNQLLAIGLTPGTTFKVIRKAPLGDPITISIRGSIISLRKKEAEILELEKL